MGDKKGPLRQGTTILIFFLFAFLAQQYFNNTWVLLDGHHDSTFEGIQRSPQGSTPADPSPYSATSTSLRLDRSKPAPTTSSSGAAQRPPFEEHATRTDYSDDRCSDFFMVVRQVQSVEREDDALLPQMWERREKELLGSGLMGRSNRMESAAAEGWTGSTSPFSPTGSRTATITQAHYGGQGRQGPKRVGEPRQVFSSTSTSLSYYKLNSTPGATARNSSCSPHGRWSDQNAGSYFDGAAEAGQNCPQPRAPEDPRRQGPRLSIRPTLGREWPAASFSDYETNDSSFCHNGMAIWSSS